MQQQEITLLKHGNLTTIQNINIVSVMQDAPTAGIFFKKYAYLNTNVLTKM